VIALRRLLSLAFLAALLTFASPLSVAVFAGAEEHHETTSAPHESGHHAPPALGDLLFPAINFAIYLAIVVRYVIPAMREYLRRRRADVVEAEATSTAALTQAERSLSASRERLAGLKSEVESIRQDLLTIATRQAERLKAQAEETGGRRLADASLLAEQERRRALGGLRAELATAAALLAEGRIRGALTPDDQRSFVQQFLKDAATR
jgi:F-type H+-transporting ATPase subunit b